MDKADITIKVGGLLENIKSDLHDEVRRLVDSGAIDIEGYDSDYILPKMLLAVALENHSKQVVPPASWKKEKRVMANLRKF